MNFIRTFGFRPQGAVIQITSSMFQIMFQGGSDLRVPRKFVNLHVGTCCNFFSLALIVSLVSTCSGLTSCQCCDGCRPR